MRIRTNLLSQEGGTGHDSSVKSSRRPVLGRPCTCNHQLAMPANRNGTFTQHCSVGSEEAPTPAAKRRREIRQGFEDFTRQKRVQWVARIKSNGSGTKDTHTREPAPEQRNFCLWRWPWAYSFPTMPTVTVKDSWNDSQVGPGPLSALRPAESFAEAALRQADWISRMCDSGSRESDSGCHWGCL